MLVAILPVAFVDSLAAYSAPLPNASVSQHACIVTPASTNCNSPAFDLSRGNAPPIALPMLKVALVELAVRPSLHTAPHEEAITEYAAHERAIGQLLGAIPMQHTPHKGTRLDLICCDCESICDRAGGMGEFQIAVLFCTPSHAPRLFVPGTRPCHEESRSPFDPAPVRASCATL